MNFKKLIKTAGYDLEITFSKTKKVATKLLASNLLYVEKHSDIFRNDIRINRYMKKLIEKVRKNMVTATTQGFGSSSAFYYISTETLIKILQNEIKLKEMQKALSKKSKHSSFDYAIQNFEKDIIYFSKDEFKGKYFSLNGQHRMDAIVEDMKGGIAKSKTDIEYAPYVISDESYTFDSLHDLKKKLCSANNDERFEAVKTLSIEDGTDAYHRYLEDCDVYIFEIAHADSFDSISQYIWYSNTSTSWSLFEHSFKQIKNPFTTYVMDNIASNDTKKSSPVQELIYEKTGIDWGTGKFKKTAGGFEYLLGLTFDTCFNPDSINLLSNFGFRAPDELLKTILSADFVATESDLKEWHKLLLSVSKVIAKLRKENKNGLPVLKTILKKPSTLINCILLIRYLDTSYSYKASNGNTYKIKTHQDNYENIVKGYLAIAVKYSNEMHPINTYFWETDTSREMLKAMGQSTPVISKDSIKDPAFYGKFEEILTLCKTHKRDKSDNTVAFYKHIGDSFAFGWNKNHQCVINVIKTHLDESFIRTKEQLKTGGIFGDLSWVDSSPLVDSKFLVPTENDDVFIDTLWATAKHRGHEDSKSKGGTNKVENLELEDASINVITKNVV